MPRRRNLRVFPVARAAIIEPTASAIAIAPISQTPAPYTSRTNLGRDTHIEPAKPMLASDEANTDTHSHGEPNTYRNPSRVSLIVFATPCEAALDGTSPSGG